MRIIGGHDYYDKFVQYGVDNKIILNRNNSIKYDNLKLSDELDKIYRIPSVSIYIKNLNIDELYDINHYSYKKNNYSLSAGFVNVIIGNNEYKGVSLLVDNKTNFSHKTHYIWNIEALNKHLGIFNCINVWKPNSYNKGINENYFIPPSS